MGDKNNFRKKDSGKMKINIKRRYKYFRVHDFIMIICLLTIAMMSGAIAGEYIVDSSLPAYSNNSNNNSTKSDESTGTQNINAIKKVSSSLVTIAGSKEALDKNSYSAGNLTGIVYDKKGNIITNASKVKNKSLYIWAPTGQSKLKAAVSPLVFEMTGKVKSANSDISVEICNQKGNKSKIVGISKMGTIQQATEGTCT